MVRRQSRCRLLAALCPTYLHLLAAPTRSAAVGRQEVEEGEIYEPVMSDSREQVHKPLPSGLLERLERGESVAVSRRRWVDTR